MTTIIPNTLIVFLALTIVALPQSIICGVDNMLNATIVSSLIFGGILTMFKVDLMDVIDKIT